MTDQEQACQEFLQSITMPMLAHPETDAESVCVVLLWSAIYCAIRAGATPEIVAGFRDAADALENGLTITFEGGVN